MAVKSTTESPDFTTKDYLDARDAVIRSEITGMSDRLTVSMGELKNDIDDRLGTLGRDLQLRPTSSNLHRTVAVGAASLFVGLLAVLAILWAAVDTGASMTASFSEDVLETQQAHQNQAQQIKAMNARYEQIDTKLNTLIQASAQVSYSEPQGTSRIGAKTEPERKER